MEDKNKRNVEPVGAYAQKKAEEVTAGTEGSTQAGREQNYSSESATVRGSFVGKEGDESPPPVVHQSGAGTGQKGESQSKGTAGPTAQMDRGPKTKR